jgi:hypothetical protein
MLLQKDINMDGRFMITLNLVQLMVPESLIHTGQVVPNLMVKVVVRAMTRVAGKVMVKVADRVTVKVAVTHTVRAVEKTYLTLGV